MYASQVCLHRATASVPPETPPVPCAVAAPPPPPVPLLLPPPPPQLLTAETARRVMVRNAVDGSARPNKAGIAISLQDLGSGSQVELETPTSRFARRPSRLAAATRRRYFRL